MAENGRLERTTGVFGAVLLGLGSILGTGVFVSVGLAAGIAGPSVVLAVALAGIVAALNGLSSAQLAAAHPVSGGTYEYGYEFVSPRVGFVAGWMFLVAKSASAATAALGIAGYLLSMRNSLEPTGELLVIAALAALVLIASVVVGGLRRSNWLNAIFVFVALGSLVSLVIFGVFTVGQGGGFSLAFGEFEATNLAQAAALLFVAFAGYGRIATLGEEVREPRKTIPRAIIATLVTTVILYLSVAVVLLVALGPRVGEVTRDSAAPLEAAARFLQGSELALVIRVGAAVAMAGVLLNLLLGLSRVLLAMARRRDMPGYFAVLDRAGKSPRRAVIAVALFIASLTLFGRIEWTWSFSAFTVLMYYALTNLAAWRLPQERRLYPRWMAGAGLLGCLSLAAFVEWRFVAIGTGIIIAAAILHPLIRSRHS